METEAARTLRAARRTGAPEFVTTPTRVESTGLVIPPIRAEAHHARRWRLERDWSYRLEEWELTVPHGWETDLASIPWPLRYFVNSFELGITGPLLHDFLYEHGGCPPPGSCRPWRRFSRREADRIFLRLMRAERVTRWRREVGYLTVRALGRTHWEEPAA